MWSFVLFSATPRTLTNLEIKEVPTLRGVKPSILQTEAITIASAEKPTHSATADDGVGKDDRAPKREEKTQEGAHPSKEGLLGGEAYASGK